MPFALIGFFLASHQSNFEWETFIYVILCMIFARSAAMAFNRYIDRDIDTANPRTSEIREIPNGSIKANSALVFVIINALLFITTTFLINPICFSSGELCAVHLPFRNRSIRYTCRIPSSSKCGTSR